MAMVTHFKIAFVDGLLHKQTYTYIFTPGGMQSNTAVWIREQVIRLINYHVLLITELFCSPVIFLASNDCDVRYNS
jgi:hypothetical protein